MWQEFHTICLWKAILWKGKIFIVHAIIFPNIYIKIAKKYVELSYLTSGLVTPETYCRKTTLGKQGLLRCLTSSALDHISLPHEFESRRGHIWSLFHLWLCFIVFGGRSAHLAYHMYKVAVKRQSSSLSPLGKHPRYTGVRRIWTHNLYILQLIALIRMPLEHPEQNLYIISNCNWYYIILLIK